MHSPPLAPLCMKRPCTATGPLTPWGHDPWWLRCVFRSQAATLRASNVHSSPRNPSTPLWQRNREHLCVLVMNSYRTLKIKTTAYFFYINHFWNQPSHFHNFSSYMSRDSYARCRSGFRQAPKPKPKTFSRDTKHIPGVSPTGQVQRWQTHSSIGVTSANPAGLSFQARDLSDILG